MSELEIIESTPEGGTLPEEEIPEPSPELASGETMIAVPEAASVGYYAKVQAATQITNPPQGPAKYLNYWGASAGTPWCTFFLAWCVDTCQVGGHNHSCAWRNYGGVGYSGAVLAWGNAAGKTLRSGATPQSGDFYVVDGNAHAGIVEGASANQIWTINGNWNHRPYPAGVVAHQLWNRVSGDTWDDGSHHTIRFVRW